MLGFPWLGPERRPKTQRTGLFLMALSWGYGGVDYKCSGSMSEEDFEFDTQIIMLLLNGSLALMLFSRH